MKNNITINCQSSIRIEDKNIIYFDPYKIEKPINDADLIFITHDHFDHYDKKSLKNILKPDTIIIIPSSILNKIDYNDFKNNKIISVEPNNIYNILEYQIETIPSYNINKQFHPRANNYVGYIITINKERIYISGDTDMTTEAQNVKCDIALIPIGGTYTMNYQEGAELINIIKPKLVIPTHYNCVVGNLEDGEKFKKLINNNIECNLLIK